MNEAARIAIVKPVFSFWIKQPPSAESVAQERTSHVPLAHRRGATLILHRGRCSCKAEPETRSKARFVSVHHRFLNIWQEHIKNKENIKGINKKGKKLVKKGTTKLSYTFMENA